MVNLTFLDFTSSNFEVEYIGGADPELVFLNKDEKEIEVFIHLILSFSH